MLEPSTSTRSTSAAVTATLPLQRLLEACGPRVMVQRGEASEGFSVYLDFAEAHVLDCSRTDQDIAILADGQDCAGAATCGATELPAWVGFFGYEFLAKHMGITCRARRDIPFPDGLFARPQTVAHWQDGHVSIRSELTGRAARLLAEATKENTGTSAADSPALSNSGDLRCNFDFESYGKVFAAAQDEIRRGNTYQIKISQRFETASRPDPVLAFTKLISSNPAPEAFLLRWDDWALVSCSPETVISQRGRHIATRPIGGTFPRDSSDPDASTALRYLRSDAKENAEHNMLVDLERNDLNRICRSGSVTISELRKVETYAHVHHLVTEISGELAPDVSLADTLRSLLPGGSITGCPKHRTIELIDRFEPSFRGPYTGSFGTLSRNGDLRLNLIIRTLLLTPEKAYVQAGGGIVIGSTPEYEYRENQLKAQALLDLL